MNAKKRMDVLERVINEIKAEECHRIEEIRHLVLGLIGLVSNLERAEVQLKEVGADLPELFKAVKEWKEWLGVAIENLNHIECTIPLLLPHIITAWGGLLCTNSVLKKEYGL